MEGSWGHTVTCIGNDPRAQGSAHNSHRGKGSSWEALVGDGENQLASCALEGGAGCGRWRRKGGPQTWGRVQGCHGCRAAALPEHGCVDLCTGRAEAVVWRSLGFDTVPCLNSRRS